MTTERAKGLVNMVIQRRNYLKNRQKARNSQTLSKNNNNNNLSIVSNWLRPGSRLSSPNREISNPFLQIRPSISQSIQSKYEAGSSGKQGHNVGH